MPHTHKHTYIHTQKGKHTQKHSRSHKRATTQTYKFTNKHKHTKLHTEKEGHNNTYIKTHMNSERSQALEVYLCEQWAHSLTNLPAEVVAFVSKHPSQQFLEAHYYEYMMKLFGEKSQSTDGCQPPSLGAQSVKSAVGMGGILQKRSFVAGKEVARSPEKEWNCHDLLHEPTGTGLQWRLTCILLHAGEARNFKSGGAAAAIGTSSGGPSSPKKSRVDVGEKDRVVMDCVLADNTGPLLATFWDECA